MVKPSAAENIFCNRDLTESQNADILGCAKRLAYGWSVRTHLYER